MFQYESVGDHMRPRGVLEDTKYKVIGEAFKFVKDLNLPLEAKPLRDIAIVYPGSYDSAMFTEGRGDAEVFEWPPANGLSGSTKLLCDTHQQFDVLTQEQALDLINEYNLIVLPEAGELKPEMVEAIRGFVNNGGSLVATGNSSFSKGKFELGDVLGIRYLSEGPYDSNSSIFLRLYDYDKGMPEGIDFKAYGGYIQVVPEDGAEVKAHVVAPSAGGRFYTGIYKGGPAERLLDSPGIVYNKYGKGQAIYVATPLFTSYYQYAYHGHKTLLDNIITSLQNVRVLDAEAPASVRLNVMNTDEGMFVHVVNYYADDGGSTIPRINSWPPAMDITVKVFAPSAKKVTPVTNAKFDVKLEDGYVNIKLHAISAYEVLKIN